MFAEEPEFRVGFVFVGLLMGSLILSVAVNTNRRGIHDLISGAIAQKLKTPPSHLEGVNITKIRSY